MYYKSMVMFVQKHGQLTIQSIEQLKDTSLHLDKYHKLHSGHLEECAPIGQHSHQLIPLQNMFPTFLPHLKQFQFQPTNIIMKPHTIPSTSTTNPCLPSLQEKNDDTLPFSKNSHTFSNLTFNVTNQHNSLASTPTTLKHERHRKQYACHKDELNKHRQLTRSKQKYPSMEFPVDPIQHQALTHTTTPFYTSSTVGKQVHGLTQMQTMLPPFLPHPNEIHLPLAQTIMQPNIFPSTSKTNPSLPFMPSTTDNIPLLNTSHTSSNLNFNLTNQINSIPSTLNTLANEKRRKQYLHHKDELNKRRRVARSKGKHLSMDFPFEPTQHQSLAHITQTFPYSYRCLVQNTYL
jgi:hypothetical protein